MVIGRPNVREQLNGHIAVSVGFGDRPPAHFISTDVESAVAKARVIFNCKTLWGTEIPIERLYAEISPDQRSRYKYLQEGIAWAESHTRQDDHLSNSYLVF